MAYAYAVLYRMPGQASYQTAMAVDVWAAQRISDALARQGAKTRVMPLA